MRDNILNFEKGYILPSVLLISLLVVTLLFGIISILFFYNSYSIKLIKKKELDLACFSAIQLFMSDFSGELNNERVEKIDSIMVKLSPRLEGIYLKVTATAYNKVDSSKVNYYLGNALQAPFDNAIIITKPNLRAAVSGETKIIGNILGTSEKIKRGRIPGKSSASNNYLVGKLVKNEDIAIKLFNEELISNLFIEKVFSDNSNYIDGDFELNRTTLKQISKDRINIINGDLIISGIFELDKSNIQLKFDVLGKTIFEEETNSNLDLYISSDSSLIIEDNSVLENIIVVTKSRIEINSGANLKNAQLFCQGSIVINNSILKYPSTIVMYSNTEEENNLKNNIEINSSTINGIIMLVNTTVGLANNKNIITIDDNSKIQGIVYSENNVNVSGKISGVIYTHNFWFYKEPTEYINWIVDLKIDRSKLDENYLLPIGLGNNSNLKILNEKWIN